MKQFYHPMTEKKNFFQLNAQSDYKIAYRLKLPFPAKYYNGTLEGNRNSKVVHLTDTLFFFNFQYSASFLLLFIVFEGLKWFLLTATKCTTSVDFSFLFFKVSFW